MAAHPLHHADSRWKLQVGLPSQFLHERIEACVDLLLEQHAANLLPDGIAQRLRNGHLVLLVILQDVVFRHPHKQANTTVYKGVYDELVAKPRLHPALGEASLSHDLRERPRPPGLLLEAVELLQNLRFLDSRDLRPRGFLP
jgi:hypothetical protein